jgi:regulator of sirC expression with transglutaminase-like and TPR domain
LKTRQGIPISLAVLWLEVALGIGLNAKGVNFPGHFLIKVQLSFPSEGQVIIDPFTGRSLSKEDLLEMLQGLPDLPALKGWAEPASKESFTEEAPHEQGHQSSGSDWSQNTDLILMHYLKSTTEREILKRMLFNLLEIYKSQDDPIRQQQVQARMQILQA